MQHFDQVSVRYCSLKNRPCVGPPVDGVKGGIGPLVLVSDVFKKRFVGPFVLQAFLLVVSCHSAIGKHEMCSCNRVLYENVWTVCAKLQVVCFRLCICFDVQLAHEIKL
jgi:hypothetical protein